jgi:hypothetical protein
MAVYSFVNAAKQDGIAEEQKRPDPHTVAAPGFDFELLDHGVVSDPLAKDNALPVTRPGSAESSGIS